MVNPCIEQTFGLPFFGMDETPHAHCQIRRSNPHAWEVICPNCDVEDAVRLRGPFDSKAEARRIAAEHWSATA